MLTELLARFAYWLLCTVCLATSYYLTMGWQWEWFTAMWINQCQSVNYCFMESLDWERQQTCKISIAQCWEAAYYGTCVSFYGIGFTFAPALSKLLLLRYILLTAFFQISGFLNPGLAQSKRPGFGFLMCWSYGLFGLPLEFAFCCLVEELSIERLDSELQQFKV